VTSGNGQKTIFDLYDTRYEESYYTYTDGETGELVGVDNGTLDTGYYMPLKQQKPDGNVLLYKKGRIEVVNSSKGVCYGWIDLESHGSHSLEAKSSDGKTAKYIFNHDEEHGKEKLKRNCLKKAIFSHKPEVGYKYADYTIPLVTKKSYPNGRFQTVNYYHTESNTLQGLGKIHIKDKEDFRRKKVKAVFAPVGTNGNPIMTHQFVYELAHPKSKHSRGRTKVYDAYGTKTAYEFNSNHRPTRLRRYQRDNKVYSSEGYVSADHQSPYQEEWGNLLGKFFRDEKGNILSAHFFDYDQKGNVTKKRFLGNLTGKNPCYVILDKNDQPIEKEVECYRKSFKYSNDQFNLLLTEEESNGKGIRYTYYPQTDLACAKYITEKGAIRFTEFYSYDKFGTLIGKIKDNDSNPGQSNLANVTERHILIIAESWSLSSRNYDMV